MIATGLSIGTLFTLFVVPAVYVLLATDRRAAAAADVRQVPQPHAAGG